MKISCDIQQMGVSINGGTPRTWVFFGETPIKKSMISGGTPIYQKPILFIAIPSSLKKGRPTPPPQTSPDIPRHPQTSPDVSDVSKRPP